LLLSLRGDSSRRAFPPPLWGRCIDRGHGGHLFGDIVDTFRSTNREGLGCRFGRCR
jgi:hypothetical protein